MSENTAARRPLTGAEITIIKHLALHCGMGGVVTLKQWQRPHAAALWKLYLVEIWYRQSPTSATRSEGPFYGLTDRGKRLAATLFTENERAGAHAPPRNASTQVAPGGSTQPKEQSHARTRV